MNILLWIIQVLLAALFLFAGTTKFLMPAEEMAKGLPAYMSLSFIYFIGTCEILGALGLIIPWATGIMRWLTPLAAALLVIIMIGAVVVSPKDALIAIPSTVGILCAIVAIGRKRQLANSPAHRKS
ncbi:MAG: DoxX family protein [Acidobacteria bacterium]|nr:DoxX family protein [Acidobacteriota bacterium]